MCREEIELTALTAMLSWSQQFVLHQSLRYDLIDRRGMLGNNVHFKTIIVYMMPHANFGINRVYN